MSSVRLLYISIIFLSISCSKNEVNPDHEPVSMNAVWLETGFSYNQGKAPIIEPHSKGWDLYSAPGDILGIGLDGQELYSVSQPGADLSGFGEAIVRFGDTLIFRLAQDKVGDGKFFLEKFSPDRKLLDRKEIHDAGGVSLLRGIGVRNDQFLVFAYEDVNFRTHFFEYHLDLDASFYLFSLNEGTTIIKSLFLGKSACFLVNGIEGYGTLGLLALEEDNSLTKIILRENYPLDLTRETVIMNNTSLETEVYTSGGLLTSVNKTGSITRLNEKRLFMDGFDYAWTMAVSPKGTIGAIFKRQGGNMTTGTGSLTISGAVDDLYLAEFSSSGELLDYRIINNTEELRSYGMSLYFEDMDHWSLLGAKSYQETLQNGTYYVIKPE